MRKLFNFHEVAQGLIDGEGFLLGLGQPIDVFQHKELAVSQLVVELAAAAQFATEQQQSPPAEEPRVIFDHGLEASVGQSVELPVEVGPEMPNRLNQSPAQSYDLPAFRRCSVTWVWT